MKGAVRLTCLAGAVALGVVTVAGSALGDTAAPLPSIFAGVASATGMLEHLDSTPGVAPTSQPFFAAFADGDSTYAAQTIYARADPYNPGDTVTGLGPLLCTAGLPPACGFPPYALSATANQQHPNASVGFSPEAGPTAGAPVAVTGMSGVAHADLTGVSTLSEIGGFDESQGAGSGSQVVGFRRAMEAIVGHSINAPSSTLVHVGSMRSTTTQHFDHGTLVVTADDLDSDVTLLGGLIHVGSITATSKSTSNGEVIHTHTDNAAINNVTVAGMPATIDEKGVTVTGATLVPGSQVTAANALLHQTLAALGIEVHFVGHSEGLSVLQPRTCTHGEADGLVMHASAPLTSLPTIGAVYFNDLAIGSACTSVSVGAAAVSEAGPQASPPLGGGAITQSQTGGPPTAPAPGGSGASGVTLAPGSIPTPVAAPPSAPATQLTAPATAAGPSRSLESELATGVVAHRLTLLYLIFGLVSLAVLLGAKPLTRPRLPRGL